MSTTNTKKPRAKRGCDMCRKKKTRCDCYIQLPCSKCRQAKTDCTFLVDQKKRGPVNRKYVENLEHRIEQMENLIRKQAPSKQSHESPENAYQRPFEEFVNIQPLPQQQQQEQHTFIHESSLSSLSSATPSPIMNDTATHQQILPDPMIVDNNQMLNGSSIPTTSAKVPEGGSTPSDSPSNTIDRDFDLILEEMNGLTIRDYQRTRYVGYSLGLQCLGPNFFRSNRKHRLLNEPNWFVQKINHEDEEHVIMKTKEIMQPQFLYHEPTPERFKRLKDSCMTDELADFLIHVFFTRAHQHYPVVNKVQFLEQYYFQNPCPPDKFLLWTIIAMGAKMAQVWTGDMDNFNYTSQQLHTVHRRFCDLAHGILALAHQRSMISTVQTLLLLGMLVREEKQEDEDTSHWVIVGLAIRLAYDLGLHLDCSDWHIPYYEMEQRRRIFWVAYMTDCWVAAQQGRPLTIIDGQFDVRYPTAYEIGTTHRTRTRCTPVLILEAEVAKEQNLPVYYIFKEIIGLHKVLSKIITHFYNRFTRVKQVKRAEELYVEIEKEMLGWWDALPSDCKTRTLNDGGTETVLLRVNYHCVCLLLHRPFVRMNTSFSAHALEVCNRNGHIIISMAEEIEKHFLVTLPWSLTTYSLFQASLVYAYNIYSPDPKIRECAIGYLFRCAQIYKKDPYLQKTFGSQILQTILSNINQTPTDECDEHESQVPENDTTDCQDTYEVEKKNSFIYKAIREHVKIAVEHDF